MHPAFVLSHQWWPVTCAWTQVKCLLIQYSLNVNKSAPRLHCRFVGGASQLISCPNSNLWVKSEDKTTSQLALAHVNHTVHLHLHVPYSSVCYNYIIIMQWLVGWLVRGLKQIGSLCWQKKAHCGLVLKGQHFQLFHH